MKVRVSVDAAWGVSAAIEQSEDIIYFLVRETSNENILEAVCAIKLKIITIFSFFFTNFLDLVFCIIFILNEKKNRLFVLSHKGCLVQGLFSHVDYQKIIKHF